MVWTWQSQRPGSTSMPSVEMTSASFGTSSFPTCPMAVMRSFSTRMTLFASGGPPKPSIRRPPTSAVRPAEAEARESAAKGDETNEQCENVHGRDCRGARRGLPARRDAAKNATCSAICLTRRGEQAMEKSAERERRNGRGQGGREDAAHFFARHFYLSAPLGPAARRRAMVRAPIKAGRAVA